MSTHVEDQAPPPPPHEPPPPPPKPSSDDAKGIQIAPPSPPQHGPPPPPPKPSPSDTIGNLATPLTQQFPPRQSSKENSAFNGRASLSRKPVPISLVDGNTRIRGGPLSPVHINTSSEHPIPQPSSTQVETSSMYSAASRTPSGEIHLSRNGNTMKVGENEENVYRVGLRSPVEQPPAAFLADQHNRKLSSPRIITPESEFPQSRHVSSGSIESERAHKRSTSYGSSRSYENVDLGRGPMQQSTGSPTPLEYHHLGPNQTSTLRMVNNKEPGGTHGRRPSSSSPLQSPELAAMQNNDQNGLGRGRFLGEDLSRPNSAFSSQSELYGRGRVNSPQSPSHHPRAVSSHGARSPDNRLSYVDLLNVPYPQPAPAAHLDNAHLRTAVGTNASLLSTKKTLEMYRANVKKTNDPAIQYEFAIFMINAAQEAAANGQDLDDPRKTSPSPGRDLDGTFAEHMSDSGPNINLLREARQILQRLSDKSYPFAQYYLADGYASGLFNKGKEDNDRAFPLFVAASKHGHAEAGYRAALCYEYGWGTRSDPLKAVQFYRQSASKNHPGAMARLGRACLQGELGLGERYREGIKWLKRAAESADFQYNASPYELGLLHETGYGDDIFIDEAYAAQLFTQSADLGHAEANYRLGDAYEHGKLKCPRDPALSVHFYTGAAQRGHPLAMMALCAWYMVGAEPVLEKDEAEAYEWAKKAAECGKFQQEYTSLSGPSNSG